MGNSISSCCPQQPQPAVTQPTHTPTQPTDRQPARTSPMQAGQETIPLQTRSSQVSGAGSRQPRTSATALGASVPSHSSRHTSLQSHHTGSGGGASRADNGQRSTPASPTRATFPTTTIAEAAPSVVETLGMHVAGPEHATAAHEFFNRLPAETWTARFASESTDPASRQRETQTMLSRANNVFNSTADGRWTGVASLYGHPVAELTLMADPSVRGQGRKLMEGAIARARELGITELIGEITTKSDRRAITLVESFGFQRTIDPRDHGNVTWRLNLSPGDGASASPELPHSASAAQQAGTASQAPTGPSQSVAPAGQQASDPDDVDLEAMFGY